MLAFGFSWHRKSHFFLSIRILKIVKSSVCRGALLGGTAEYLICVAILENSWIFLTVGALELILIVT